MSKRCKLAFDAWRVTLDGAIVEREVVNRARALKGRGWHSYGISSLWESIRYDRDVGLLGDGTFKINNNHRAYMARYVMENYPDLMGFFKIRALKGVRYDDY